MQAERLRDGSVGYGRRRPIFRRSRPMKVLVLGLSRTGTTSMCQALEILGYRCYHFAECMKNYPSNKHVVLWNQAVDAKYRGTGTPYSKADFEEILWNFDAISDIPCVLFVDELLEAYPDAKVILTNRDLKQWLDSVEKTSFRVLRWRPWRIMSMLDSIYFAPYTRAIKTPLQIWSGGDWQSKEKLALGFRQHYSHVRAIVAQQNLLEFSLGEGWGRLCEFLDKPEPKLPWPHRNASADAEDNHYRRFRIWTLMWLARVTCWALILALPVAFSASYVR